MVRNKDARFALFVLVVLTLLFGASITPLAAQEATEAANPDATPVPVVIVTPEPSPAPETVQLTWAAVAGIVSLTLAVGLTGGFGGALLIIRAVKGNTVVMDAIEKLYLSAPPETQKLLRGGAVVLKEGGDLADQLTDGVLTAEAVRAIVGDELSRRGAVG